MKTIDQTFVKSLPDMYLWTRKSALNFESHPNLNLDLEICEGILTIVGPGIFGKF